MTITLTNTSGRLKAFTLPHESYCVSRGRCACTVVSARDARRVPSSLTLAAGTRADNVDEAVLAVADVIRALRAGELRVERTPPPSTKPVSRENENRRAAKRTRGEA